MKQFHVLLYRHTIFTIACAAIMYILSNSYVFKTQKQLSVYLHDVYNCNDQQPATYPATYYRKRIDDGDSYFVYNIKIGKIFSNILHKSRSPTLVEEYSHMIHTDVIRNRVRFNKSAAESVAMRKQYETYFTDQSKIQCRRPWNHANVGDVDFFKFIQFNSRRTKHLHLNFYNLLPIEHVLRYNHSGYYAQLPINYTLPLNNSNTYVVPKVFSYTISVKKRGTLSSLQFRFGEIIGVLQHDKLKHLLLNGIHNNLLWAGECYYIYDHKYNKYVFVMDNNSGHWKPNILKIPYYLKYILTQTLFPDYSDDESGHGYEPLILIDYHYEPWHRVKKTIFPILGEISKRDGVLNKQRKAEWKAKWKQRKNH